MASNTSQAARRYSRTAQASIDDFPSLPPNKQIERSDTVKTTETTKPKRPRFSTNPWPIGSTYNIHDEPRFQSFDPKTEYEVEEKPTDAAELADAEGGIFQKQKTRRHSIKELFKEPVLPDKDYIPTIRRKSTVKSVTGNYIVTFKGEDDPEDPKNWKMGRKWSATVLVSLFTFMAPLTSSMIAPCLDIMAKDFGVTNQVEKIMMLSIFMLAFAIGPLVFGPLSEIYGRIRVLQATNVLYLIFNLACGFAQNSAQMMAFRFLAGLGGSAAPTIGTGVLGDCWRTEQRGLSTSIYSLAPLIGPALGPIAGGFIGQHISWRWVFWISSMIDLAIQLVGAFLLKETFAPTLLHQKAKKLRKETGDEKYISEYELSSGTMPQKIRTALFRPLKFLWTQRIVQALAVFQAYFYGLTFVVYATFSTLWTDRYGFSIGVSGLQYLAPAIGFAIGAQLVGRLNDVIYVALKARNHGVDKPEFRSLVGIPAMILVCGGLFWYGWSAEAKLFWLMPDIGIAIFAFGCDVIFQCTNAYLVDCYGRYSASATAAVIFLRSLCAFGFPLFAENMFKDLGYGWGNTILALVIPVVGLPAPFALWRWGPSLRAKSQFTLSDG